MSFTDAELHTRGESLFVGDIQALHGCLHAAVFPAPIAHGRIVRLALEAARRELGVAAVFSAADIPGDNQIGNVVLDEPLLADGTMHYVGQPVALVVADSAAAARHVLGAIELKTEALPAVFDAREAYRLGQCIGPERTFALGDVDVAWGRCDVVVEGRTDTGSQEHAYLETQVALAIPQENGALKVYSATQSPSVVQKLIARVLGCPMHQVEVEVPRLGGGFGGKEEQAAPWAVLAALAAHCLQRPVRLALRRDEDMRMTGKRHPYSADFKIGLTRDGKILAYAARFYQNAGATADLSTAILERSLFHATGCYAIPNVRIQAVSCRTNLPSNTACRGFGAPQAAFVMEAALFRAATAMRVEPAELQQRNLLQEGDELPYGQRVERCRAGICWDTAAQRYGLDAWRERVARFNADHSLEKKGLAVMPLCFGISFTSAFLNQAGALVHVYVDGSVNVSTGAIEMGQGVKAKLREIAARSLGIEPDRVRVENTSTARVANVSPTAASTGADLNGHAVRAACLAIGERLREVALRSLRFDASATASESGVLDIRLGRVFLDEKETALDWPHLVQQAYLDRVNLSAQAYYATPHIHFDRSREKGRPFAYHVFGTAFVEATVDCLRGTYRIDTAKVVHDVGESLVPAVDLGQAEGALVQGLGWLTMEELLYDGQGRLLTHNLGGYKVPDLDFSPEIEMHFLENAPNPAGLLQSKAVGEPPLLYGIAGYFALRAALRAFRPGLDATFSAPLTPEKVLMALHGEAS